MRLVLVIFCVMACWFRSRLRPYATSVNREDAGVLDHGSSDLLGIGRLSLEEGFGPLIEAFLDRDASPVWQSGSPATWHSLPCMHRATNGTPRARSGWGTREAIGIQRRSRYNRGFAPQSRGILVEDGGSSVRCVMDFR